MALSKKNKSTQRDKNMGAPTKKTEERVRVLEELMGEGQFVETACALAEISKDTYYRWYNDDFTFRTRMNRALYGWLRGKHNKLSEDDLWKVIKNRFNHLYRDKIEQELSGQGGGPIKLIVEDQRCDNE